MDLSQWAKNEPNKSEDEEEVPTGDEPEEGGEQGEADEEFTQMVRDNRAAIEAAAAQVSEEELTNFDEELSEESTNAVSDALEQMPEEFTDKLNEVEEGAIIAATEAVEEELEQVSPGVFGAWLYRASQLS